MADTMVIGLDIGGTRCKMGLVNLAKSEVAASRVFASAAGEQEFFANLLQAYRGFVALAENRQLPPPSGFAAAVGAYVFADGVVGAAIDSINFLDGFPLARHIQTLTELPCRVCNDAEAAAVGEAVFGAGHGAQRVLTLTLGTGVGVGFTVDGRPQNPDAAIHLAGHIKVRQGGEWGGCLEAEPCYCTLPGCLEASCSGTALEKLSAHFLGRHLPNEQLFTLAAAGDTAATACVDQYLNLLMTALNQYVYLFCPDVIVLGGGVANALEGYLPRLNTALTARVHSRHSPRIALSALRENAGVLGAAALFCN